MIVTVDRVAAELRKRSETPEEADRLRREAGILDVARHPGVVQLLGLDGDTLRLRLVDGEALSQRPAPSPDEFARLANGVFTTLADLHDLGVVHRCLGAEHILVDASGQPVLCSFGRASDDADPSGPDAAGDVIALANALLDSTATDPTIARILATALKAGPRGPSARRVATLLAADSPTRRHARPLLAGALLLAAATIVLIAGATTQRRPRPVTLTCPTACRDHSPASTETATDTGSATSCPGACRDHSPAAIPGTTDAGPATTCPTVDQGCRPLPRPGGVIATAAGRYRVGQPGDITVVGRWHCAAALLALLRPATGEVWVFDSWARRGGPSSARLATQIANAVSLDVDPSRTGCDLLRVTRRDGQAVVVQPGDPA